MRLVFDRFAFDSDARELLEGATPLHVGPKAFRLLEVLLAGRPRAFTKEDLYEAIWQDTFVDESNLAGLVNELRAALGDSARKPRFIRTVHGFGYAFCGEVKEEEAPASPAILRFRGHDLPLREGTNVLGRDAGADVTIDDGTVSRRHAVITIGADGATIEDLSSKNGTFVDGVRVSSAVPIREGQRIVLGDAAIDFRASAVGTTVTVHRPRKA